MRSTRKPFAWPSYVGPKSDANANHKVLPDADGLFAEITNRFVADVGALLDVVSVAVYLAQWSPIERIVADAYISPASLSMPTVSGAELGVMPLAKNDTWYVVEGR